MGTELYGIDGIDGMAWHGMACVPSRWQINERKSSFYLHNLYIQPSLRAQKAYFEKFLHLPYPFILENRYDVSVPCCAFVHACVRECVYVGIRTHSRVHALYEYVSLWLMHASRRHAHYVCILVVRFKNKRMSN